MNRSEYTPTLSRAARLRRMLTGKETSFIMEAHNGLSARIVEEAGFAGIWASGLAISSQFGVRDNNEASWTQVIDLLEFMSDATTLPILLDGDTGYGNFNNLRRLVRKLEQRGIAGVCIEDKQFPKTNSFINGEQQQLADIDEFCGKIKAGKDTQLDADFSIVARVEALIAGLGMREALTRAEAYRRAGADAILIHSKRSKPDEILEFTREWAGRSPLVIVPTKYYSTPTEVFRRAGINLVIWANHMIRSAVPAMQAAAREVFETQSLVGIEERIASVDEIFRLQGADEYAEAEKIYATPNSARAVVLAASRGDNLDALTEDRPKVMLPVAGEPLLVRMVKAFRKKGVQDITVVAGYKAEAIAVPGVRVVLNPDYQSSGELASLACALDRFGEDTVVTYGDLLFRRYILRDLLDTEAELTVVVDSTQAAPETPCDLAWADLPDERGIFGRDVSLQRVAHDLAPAQGPAPSGRWIGMLRVRGAGRGHLMAALEQLRARADFAQLAMPDLLNALIAAGHRVKVLYVNGHWLDVNDHASLQQASDFAHEASSFGSRK
ncbi:MAG TPA: phosphoenolpyruvate mutase [Nevskia sp.]|nr:phosphoenolpyruvate mutase [Nevskia sp.]